MRNCCAQTYMERYNDRVRKCTLPFFFVACDQSKNFLGKGDHDAARHSEHAVGPLGRIMALEGQAHLQDAEAKQDKANGADERENKLTQIVDHRQRIVCGQCRNCGDHHHHGCTGKDSVDSLYLSFKVVGFQVVFHYAMFSFSSF